MNPHPVKITTETLFEHEIETFIPPLGDKGKAFLPVNASVGAAWPTIRVPDESTEFKGARAAMDWYNDRLQIIIDSADSDDPGLHVRYNKDGSIAEIVVADYLMERIKRESTLEQSEWQKERDADTRGEGEGDTPTPICRKCGTEHYPTMNCGVITEKDSAAKPS